MKNTIALLSAAAIVVISAGCSSPGATGTGCPAPVDIPMSESGENLSFEDMEAIAVDVDRFGKELIGMAEADAIECVDEAGLTWRVTEQDGEMFAVTMDYRIERVNVKIENGIVTDAYSG